MRPSNPPLAIAGLVAVLFAAGIAQAGPKEQVTAAMHKFLSAKSYQASMRHDGTPPTSITMQFEAPDRYRMQTPGGTQTIVGDTMYMQAGGRSMRIPMPKGTLSQWRDPGNLAKNQAGMSVTALGSEAVDGVPAKKYRVRVSQPMPSDSVMWIGRNGYPLQIRVDSATSGRPASTTIRYSRFNDPSLRIGLPK